MSSNSAVSFEDAASLVGAMASAHSLAPRLWDETIEVMRGVETLEDFAEDSSVSLLRHWHSQPLSDSDEDIEESVDDLVVEGLGPDSLLDLVVDEVDGVGDDDGLDETDSLPRLRGSRPSSASASNRRPSDRVRRSGRLQSPPDNVASSAGLGASNRGTWRALWGGGGEMSRATYAPHSLSPVPSQLQGSTPPSSIQSLLSQPASSPLGWVVENTSSSSHSSGGDGISDGSVEEDSDGVSRVTYSPPAPSARAWPRPSDRIPAGGRRVVSAGCSSVLSGTSTAVGADAGTDVRDSRSSDDEMLWSGVSSESDEVDVMALMDALDSGSGVSPEHSNSSKELRSSSLNSNNDSSSDGEIDNESHRVVGSESLVSRGRAWAESVALRSANLPGVVDAAPSFSSSSSPPSSSPLSSSPSSSSPHDHEIVIEDVSEESDGSAELSGRQVRLDSSAHVASPFSSVDHGCIYPQQPQHHNRHQHAAPLPSSNYDLSAAFEFSRNRPSHSDQPRLPLPASHSHHDVTLGLAFTRASLAASSPVEQTSRYGTAPSLSSSAYVADASDANVQSRFHLPGHDIGRSMQALWSLQVCCRFSRTVALVVL
jgi:hypothetical protein